MSALRRLLAVAVFVAALVAGWQFAARNADPISVHYLVGRAEAVALWQALLGAFVLGAVAAGAWAFYQLAKLRLLARRYRKAAAGLEAEVHQLRHLPLAADPPSGLRVRGAEMPESGNPAQGAERGV